MWGNIFAGAMSIAQGDSPEEILKKQALASLSGGAPVGVDSASTIAPHLAQTGAEQAVASGVGSQLGSEMITQNPALTNGMGQSSNMFTQFGRDAGGFMGDTFGGVGDTLSEYGGQVNEFTGMENKDWTQLGIEQGLGAMEGTPNQPMMITPAPSAQGIPNALEGQMAGGLLSSHVKPNSPQGLDPNMIRQLQMRGLI